jgi:hypothetical protein
MATKVLLTIFHMSALAKACESKIGYCSISRVSHFHISKSQAWISPLPPGVQWTKVNGRLSATTRSSQVSPQGYGHAQTREISRHSVQRCHLNSAELGHTAIGSSRRDFFLNLAILPALIISEQSAAEPFLGPSLEIFGQDTATQSDIKNSQLLGNLHSAIGVSSRPSPVRARRTTMFMPLALLLMRSSYDIADELDYVPMNRFQKEFFLRRADEWALYRQDHESMKKAVSVSMFELSNPLYFDFISSVQYATISALMHSPAPMEFEEQLGLEPVHVVRRNPAVRNALLPSLFLERVGDRILDTLLVNFTGPDFYTQPPPPCPPASSGAAPQRAAVDGIKQLYTVLAENGYAQATDFADLGDVDAKGSERVRAESLRRKQTTFMAV